MFTKGQTNSKLFFQANVSSKKQTNEFNFTTKAKQLLLKLLQLFARDVLAMKKLEIEKTKPTFIISVLKVDIMKVGLVFSISNFFITKTSLASKWMRKKIPSCSNSALRIVHMRYIILPYIIKFLNQFSGFFCFTEMLVHYALVLS